MSAPLAAQFLWHQANSKLHTIELKELIPDAGSPSVCGN